MLRSGQVRPERFFHNGPRPATSRRLNQTRVLEICQNILKLIRPGRQIVEPIPAGSSILIALVQAFREQPISLDVSEFTPVIVNRARKNLPQIVVDRLTGKLPGCFLELRSKNLVRLVPAGKTDDTQPRRQIAVSGQVVQSRDELSMRQIPGCTENHDRTRLRHSATCEALAQRVNR